MTPSTEQSDDRRRRLIVYATPTGALAETCERYFASVADSAPTLAQDYPPHCTLTGFFERQPERVAGVVAEVDAVLDELGPVPAGAVEVRELGIRSGWVGLELESPWLLDATRRVEVSHRLTPGDDPLRLKDWLHLSLAYEIEDLSHHRDLARRLFTPLPDGGWELALWEHHADGDWTRLTS